MSLFRPVTHNKRETTGRRTVAESPGVWGGKFNGKGKKKKGGHGVGWVLMYCGVGSGDERSLRIKRH